MVRLEQFEKRYGSIHAVKPVDLEVRPGEAFVLLGANGSGKTTILRAVCGLHTPSSGRVLVDGIDVAVDPREAKRKLAYLPQRVTVPELLTGREVLAFYAGLNGVEGARVDEALELMGLADDADRYAREYSGGMVQRLGLAITWLRDVPLLLLDEPTLNLDPTGTELFREWIRKLKKQGVTVLFTSHILHEALHLADRVGVMAEGRLIKVQEVSEFRDRVLLETRVRVVLDRLTDPIVSAARAAGAEEDSCSDTSYAFKAPPHKRQKVIRAIEDTGGLIEELHTEAPNWESLAENHFDKVGEETS
ncbi:MAG: ABC transporter ATP-binding protein [bacterium]|nr:ABC transporter ATP-binding protein [bacterium]